MNTISLSGCAPIPLAHYLKALGILRLVSEQMDGHATGFWKHDSFNLTSTLEKSDLVDFFLSKYKPTPLLSPWNGGGGFYFQEGKLNQKDPSTGKKVKTGQRTQPTAATRIVDAISKSSTPRLESYRFAIKVAKDILEKNNFQEAPGEEQKDDLISELRNSWPEVAVSWVDCVAILINADSSSSVLSAVYPPLLGTGANDGNTDFTSNFMQRLCTVISVDDTALPNEVQRRVSLQASLFGEASQGVGENAAIGQFFPSAAGGMNNASGFSGHSSVNPWDFIFMMEGALLFAAAAVKRLKQGKDGAMVSPFCVRQVGAGYGSAAADDEISGRDEIWFPIWESSVGLAELQAIFSEARSQVGSRPSRNGVDFTRSIVTLGVDRGFTAFQRYGFCMRNGKNFFATPLERIPVKRNTRVDLLSDVDHWLDQLRLRTGDKSNAPASVVRALNLLENRILDLCKNNDQAHTQGVLIALGRAQKALAQSYRWTTSDNINLRPLSRLSLKWAQQSETDSVEFRLARTLASSYGFYGKDVGKNNIMFRQHLEPVVSEYNRILWDENSGNDVVWHEGNLVRVLNDILARRLMKAAQTGTEGFPDQSLCPASLEDVASFIENRFDPDLLGDLIWALGLIDWSQLDAPIHQESRDASEFPSYLYGLFRLCFRASHKDLETIPVVPSIHQLAIHGQGPKAVEAAIRRLRGSGYEPALHGSFLTDEKTFQRTAAALLFPIAFCDFSLLEKSVLRPKENS